NWTANGVGSRPRRRAEADSAERRGSRHRRDCRGPHSGSVERLVHGEPPLWRAAKGSRRVHARAAVAARGGDFRQLHSGLASDEGGSDGGAAGGLKHSSGVLLRSGVPLVVAQKMLRHRDPELTEATDGHLETDDLRAEVNRLELDGMPEPEPGRFGPRLAV